MTVTIRMSDDLDEVLELNKRIFYLDQKLAGPDLLDSTWWLAYDGKEPIGFAGLAVKNAVLSVTGHEPVRLDDVWEGHLVRAGVVKEARGKNLQRRLISVRVREAKRLGCLKVVTYTATKNIASQRSLISCGFKPYWYEFAQDNAFIYFSKELDAKK